MRKKWETERMNERKPRSFQEDALASGAHPLENCIKKHSRRSSQKLLDTFVAFDCLSNNFFFFFFFDNVCECACVFMPCHVCECIYPIFFVHSLSHVWCSLCSNSIKTNMAQIVKRKTTIRNTIECYQYDGKILKIYNYMVNIFTGIFFTHFFLLSNCSIGWFESLWQCTCLAAAIDRDRVVWRAK